MEEMYLNLFFNALTVVLSLTAFCIGVYDLLSYSFFSQDYRNIKAPIFFKFFSISFLSLALWYYMTYVNMRWIDVDMINTILSIFGLFVGISSAIMFLILLRFFMGGD